MRPRPLPSCGLVLALALGLTACSDDTDPGQPAIPKTSKSQSSDGPKGKTLRDSADQVLAFAESAPVASATGKLVAANESSSPATAEIIKVNVHGASTMLLLRLKTPAEFTPDTAFFEADENGNSVDGITLTVGASAFYPGTYRYSKAALAQNCTCTELLRSLGPEGVWVAAEFEALPAGTATARLTIPGFAPLDVPVTTI